MPGCIVSAGWFEGLHAAAHTDSTIATAGALTTADVGLAPVETGAGDERLARLAAAVRAGSPRALPRVLPSGRDCVYVKRSAIELVGDLGSGWSAAGTHRDFYVRSLERGLCHVIADDVIVSSPGPGTAAADAGRDAGALTLARSLSAARRATHRLSLVVDARIVGSLLTGTQVHVIELIGALARTERVGIRALVSDELGGEARRALEALPGLELVGAERTSGLAPADVVHRPFQVSSEHDLTLLCRLGERLVVTNQDLIGYRNPSYFSSRREWDEYRRLTRRALAVADHVVFFSPHALRDALAEDLIDSHRGNVVPIGVDHSVYQDGRAADRPAAAAQLPDACEVILCLGTDLRHKNRVFALRLLEQLRRRHRWDGYLVFAGPHLPIGSSAVEEARMLARAPSLAERTIDVGAVDEPEKLWLLGRAGLVLYPTVYEGFGLVPFEAAEHGLPCMWAPAIVAAGDPARRRGDDRPVGCGGDRRPGARAVARWRGGFTRRRPGARGRRRVDLGCDG